MAAPLWLAAEFPLLPLHALGLDWRAAHAVLDERQHLCCSSPAAIAAGLQPDMPASSASAVAPALPLHPRQPAAESQLLNNLASWALQFSAKVCVVPGQGLVLEIGGSLRLFGGLTALLTQVRGRGAALDLFMQLAVAPNPAAASLLARHAPDSVVRAPARLQAALSRLPLDCLDWPAKTRDRLRAVGMRSLGDCLALPRDGFRQRHGVAALRQLDRLLGRAPDPRNWHQPPAQFRRELELHCETAQLALIEPGFIRLFQELAGVLRGRDCGASRLELLFSHAGERPPSQLSLQLQGPGRDPDHWLRLFRARQNRWQLPAPVRAIALHCKDFAPLRQAQTSLFQERGDSQREQVLLEELSARLGPARVFALGTVADHRPEQAWQRRDPGQGQDAHGPHPQRPLWLLDPPQPIAFAAVQLLSGPERIESGWWDGSICRRDYYQGRDTRGSRLWVFRSHEQPPRWFVHGLFA